MNALVSEPPREGKVRKAPSLILAVALAVLGALMIGLLLWGPEAASLRETARSGLTTSDLAVIGVSPPPGARAPLTSTFPSTDGVQTPLAAALGGKPGVLIFADYNCASLCGPALTLARAGLAASGLTPGRDFNLVVVGINPKDDAASARRMTQAQIGGRVLARATHALLFDPASTPALARALGYRYRYDPARGAYAHPVAAFVLGADGRLSRALSEIGLTGRDLRLALTDAGQGKVGGAGDQLRLHCYAFDPALGVYDRGVSAVVKIGALMTVAGMAAAGVGAWLSRRTGA